jgi:uncharacterized protein YdcH (DUF465 family)
MIRKRSNELKDKIHELKTTNAHFAKLFDAYHQVDKEVARIEAEVQSTSDAYAEECKKKRLHLKDEIFDMLRTV